MQDDGRKTETKMVPTGEQTIITPKIQEVVDNIPGEGPTLIKNISDYIKTMGAVQGSREPNFRRTADEIIKDYKYDGCNEAGIVFVTLLRAKGKPATYIEALNRKVLENYSHQNPNLVAHIFIETEIDGQKRFVNSTTGEITDQIPTTHIEAARGLDSWDIGLKEGFADLQRLFEEKHGMKELKIVSQEK